MEAVGAVSHLFSEFFSSNATSVLRLLVHYGWYWLPPVLAFGLWHAYRAYTLFEGMSSMEWVTLEVKLPREIMKSPLAMEVVLGAFHQTRDATWWTQITTGFRRAWFSLELVSIGGEIHFFIRTPSFFRALVESSIYSQYPNVEIYEVADYVYSADYTGPESEYDMWGGEFILTKDDPYPIKTYIHYGLEKDPKEEFKNDPITPMIEFLGAIQPGHQIWVQIMIQAAKKRYRKKDGSMGDWKDQGEAIINKLMKRDEKPKEGELKFPALSSTEKDVTEAISKSISKLGFDCGIRTIYIAKKDEFKPINFVGIIALFKQYSSVDLNGFKPNNTTSVDYPWQDPFGTRVARMKRRMLRAYRNRGYFYAPFVKSKPFVLNTEELATIYHFPGSVSETPTFGRIESRRGEPPSNLPL